jgi:predicted nucleic acid-binding protein
MADIIEEGLSKGFMSSYAINEKVIIDSRLIIQEVGVNASDSLHVFIAAVSGCEYFVTADLELIQRLKKRLRQIIPLDIHNSELMKNIFV